MALEWSSNHQEFATVDPATGLVTAVAAGSVTITATAGSGITDTIDLNIVAGMDYC